MSSMTLEQLLEQDNQEILSFAKEKGAARGPYVSPFDIGKGYKIRIDAITGVVNNLGYHQAEVQMSIIDSSGNATKAGRDWLNLPVQPEDIKAQLGEQYASKMATNLRKLTSLLAAVSDEFRSYETLDKTTDPWTFSDAEGNQIGDAELAQRKQAVAKKVTNVVRQLATAGGTVSELVGATGYKVLVEGSQPNKKGAMPTFSNFYSSDQAVIDAGFDLADI